MQKVKKSNTDLVPTNQLKARNIKFKSLSFENSSSSSFVDSPFLGAEVFLNLEPSQAIEKKMCISHSTRFYISSSEISQNSDYEDNYCITYRRNTL